MSTMWKALEELPTGKGTAADWKYFVRDAWPAWQRGFLDQRDEPARHYHCDRECGCAHRIVQHDDGSIVASCQCDPWNCDDLELTAADIVDYEFNRTRLARALGRAFDLQRFERDLDSPWTQQFATFSAARVPVILTIQQERHEFNHAVAELASRWHDGFILFAPTSRFVDCHTHELFSHARAKFFDLESHVRLQTDGTLHAPVRAGELFAKFLTHRDQPVSESAAQQVLRTLQKLRSKRAGIKAPPFDVFMCLVTDGMSQREAAIECECSLGLISVRVEELEREFKRSLTELRALASELVELQTTVKADERRKRGQGARTDQFESKGEDPDAAPGEEYQYDGELDET